MKSDIEKNLISNGIFIRKSRKKHLTGDSRSSSWRCQQHPIMKQSLIFFSVSNLLLAKYKAQIETSFSASYHQMRIEKKQFRTEDIKTLLNVWMKIESGRIPVDFPFSVVFV